MKIGLVGSGMVGSACANACVLRGVGSQMVLVDQNEALARAQAEDILHATPFAQSMPVVAGDYADLEGCKVVMIAAGVNQKPGESRLDLLRRNADVFASILPPIIRNAPDAILLIATNPVDIMTQIATAMAARSGMATNRVIGSGTILDTARFRALLGQHLGVSSHSVHAYVLGEHGDSEVLHWSGALAGAVPVVQFARDMGRLITPDVKQQIDAGVRNAAARIIQGKGATWYGIGAGMARIAQAVLNDENAILTCSRVHEDVCGVGPVALSLPAIVNASGVAHVLRPPLDASEDAALRRGASILAGACQGLSGLSHG